VVNVQWINDIIFGAKLGFIESGYSKYQQYDLCDPFLVNYDMVLHLMGMLSINYTFLYLIHWFSNKLLILKISTQVHNSLTYFNCFRELHTKMFCLPLS